MQDLTDFALLVRQHQLGVDRGVELTVAVVDLQAREPGVHPERARLVGDDRDYPIANILVAQQFLEGAHDRHRGGHLLLAGTLLQRRVHIARRQGQCPRFVAPLGHEAAQRPAPVEQVADLGRLRTGVVVRRQVRVLLQLLVGHRNPDRVAEVLEVLQRKLFHLVGGVAALEVGAERVALDGLGQDHRGLALVFHSGPVGGVHLAVVVAAALEIPDLGVGDLGHQCLGARVAAEEVVAHICAVIGLVGLEVAVRRGVHQVHQRAVLVGVQQGVPFAAPHHLDDVPAGATEEGLQLLDDLAVAPHRAVEALQVAVDDEGQVVQRLVGRHLDQAAAFRLVHLAVAQERPHVLVGGVLDAAVVQVVVEPGLIDGIHRAQAHRHRRELPELRHQSRVRVGRQPTTGMAVLLAEAVKLVCGQPALEERPGVDAGGGVALDEHLVAAARVGLAAEEVVEADLIERGRRRVGGDVPADADAGALRAVHHDRGVPPDPAPEAALHLLVAGEPRLEFGGDRVDVVGGGQRRNGDPLLAGALEQAQHQIPGPGRPRPGQQVIERFEPLGGLVGVDVGQIRGDTFPDHPDPVGIIGAG